MHSVGRVAHGTQLRSTPSSPRNPHMCPCVCVCVCICVRLRVRVLVVEVSGDDGRYERGGVQQKKNGTDKKITTK